MPPASENPAPARLGQRLEAALASRSRSPRVQRGVLLLALVTFVVVAVLAYRGLPDEVEIVWSLVPVLVLGLIPLVVLANAAEYRVIAQVAGHAPGWWSALRLTVIASAANLLPLPGALLIRAQALRLQGSSYRTAFGANVAAAVLWVACGAAAIAVLSIGRSVSGWSIVALVVVALAGLVTGAGLVVRIAQQQAGRVLVRLLLVEAATVVLSTARVYVAFRLLGLTGNLTESAALAGSIVVAAAIGIFPAGLGIRELIAAAIGVLISVDPSVAVTVMAVDRVCGIATTALATSLVLLLERRLGAPVPPDVRA